MRETLRYKRLWWILTVVVTVAALHELLRPGNEIILQFGFAPVMHLVGFGLLALWYCSLASAKRRLAVVIWLVFIGVGSEFAQHYMGLGRSGDWRDAIANMVGIGIGLAISLTIVGKWPFWVEWFLPSRGANQ